VYCIARRRDVDRCAFERANLMIGATDIVVMGPEDVPDASRSNEPKAERKGIRRRRICFNGEKCGQRIARVGRRPKSCGGRTKVLGLDCRVWDKLQEDSIDASIVVLSGSARARGVRRFRAILRRIN
jgi:hypothetical protein